MQKSSSSLSATTCPTPTGDHSPEHSPVPPAARYDDRPVCDGLPSHLLQAGLHTVPQAIMPNLKRLVYFTRRTLWNYPGWPLT